VAQGLPESHQPLSISPTPDLLLDDDMTNHDDCHILAARTRGRLQSDRDDPFVKAVRCARDWKSVQIALVRMAWCGCRRCHGSHGDPGW
jgi:hypothetical protein